VLKSGNKSANADTKTAIYTAVVKHFFVFFIFQQKHVFVLFILEYFSHRSYAMFVFQNLRFYNCGLCQQQQIKNRKNHKM